MEPDDWRVFPFNEEKCFVEVIHRDMHGEKVMAKKSKPLIKEESLSSVEEEIIESVKKETAASGKEDGKGIDFFYVLTGGGALLGLIMILFIILRYVLHMI